MTEFFDYMLPLFKNQVSYVVNSFEMLSLNFSFSFTIISSMTIIISKFKYNDQRLF